MSDLNLNENRIETIPDDLSKAADLAILRLQNNQLTLNDIPESIFVDSQVRKQMSH